MNDWHPKQILLVEDEPSVLFALRLLLEALGYCVYGFSNPKEALEFAKQDESLELCVCDLRMPHMNGLQVLTEMKQARHSMPFVLMSAHATSEETEKARKLGADAFLSKPFTPDDLTRVIESIADRVNQPDGNTTIG